MASKKAEKGISMSAPVPPRKRVVRSVTRPVPPPEKAKPAAVPQAKAPAAATAPAWDDIAQLAHSYWEARGCQGGSPEEDWARAERELRSITSVALS
jgi:hypothetical protein